MAGLWLVFTSVHGPTSYNVDHAVLGFPMLFWGMLLGGIPNLLIGAALILVAPLLTSGGRMARIGFALTLFGLIVPAIFDLIVFRALGPPLLLPFAAVGLLLLGVGSRHNTRLSGMSRRVLVLIGVLLTVAFAVALVPNALADTVGDYRIYGALAHLATGFGWVLVGAGIIRSRIDAPALLVQ